MESDTIIQSVDGPAPLTTLPLELFVHVIMNLLLPAVGRLCQTSKELNVKIGQDNYIWQLLFRRDISTQNVPFNLDYKNRYQYALDCLNNDSEYSRLSNLLSQDFNILFRRYLPQVEFKETSEQSFLTEMFRKAIRYERQEAIELFVQRGANPKYGIKMAARIGRLDILKLLERLGADLKAHAGIILDQAADGRGNLEVIDFAFSLGSPSTRVMNSVLQSASHHGYGVIVERLLPLASQSAINASLIQAAVKDHLGIVKLLLPRVTNELTLYRALRRSYRKYHNDVARLLVAAGAQWFNPLGDEADEEDATDD